MRHPWTTILRQDGPLQDVPGGSHESRGVETLDDSSVSNYSDLTRLHHKQKVAKRKGNGTPYFREI